MQVETLTDQGIESFAASPLQRFDVWEAGTGFGVRVTSKSKTFVLMARIDGKQKRIAIGRYPEMPLIEARARANQVNRRQRNRVQGDPGLREPPAKPYCPP
ncbi:MAG: DUF4102 domain-containing protein [Alphaproteobacteria bacterium]|jgi:hypothetical protein|nr:DUF4102 domain-containing protein [Alphaproteobacteria bacterium]